MDSTQVGTTVEARPKGSLGSVQLKIHQSIAFSPRNEKHHYLLKGLVQCGGCGSRYVGGTCHSRFYYRCRSRCKRLPSIREGRLERMVIKAVEKIEGSAGQLHSLPRAKLQEVLRVFGDN